MPVHGRRTESTLKIEIAFQRLYAVRRAQQPILPVKRHGPAQAIGSHPRRRVERGIVGDRRDVDAVCQRPCRELPPLTSQLGDGRRALLRHHAARAEERHHARPSDQEGAKGRQLSVLGLMHYLVGRVERAVMTGSLPTATDSRPQQHAEQVA